MDGHGETSILPYNFVARGKKIVDLSSFAQKIFEILSAAYR
jgi:hypothetical protein